MTQAMCHSADCLADIQIDEAEGVYVGWVARPGSFAAQMPVVNERGQVSLAFAGEEFPETGTLTRLNQRGHVLTENPASYLVHLYEETPEFPANLNGWFQGVLTDKDHRKTILFNDRYGMHRIYYHRSNEAFYFAAEAKAILAVRPQLRQIDWRSMGEFVSCGCVLENRTLFEDVHVLPPGSAWIFRNGALDRQASYFRPNEWEEQPILGAEQHYDSLRTVFSENIARYFQSSEAIGVSLTGGLDSRMIMAWRKAAPSHLPCYTFGGSYRECQDVVIARKVAQACGQSHVVVPLGKEFLSRFPEYAERTVYLTDGCMDVSHSPDLHVNELAAQIAPIRLTGNYGGEVLRRVRAFKPMETFSGLFAPEFLRHKEAGDSTYRTLTQCHPLSFAVFRQAPWHHHGLLSLERTQVTVRSPFLDNDLVRLLFQAPTSTLASSKSSLRLIADGDSALSLIPTDRGLVLGRKGLWSRLHREFIELTVKAEYAFDYGMPGWLTKANTLLSPLQLEQLFLGRHKFYHFRTWYQNVLSGYVKDILLDSRTLSRPFFQRNAMESMVGSHVRGEHNCTLGLHKALTLELLHRTLLDSRIESSHASVIAQPAGRL